MPQRIELKRVKGWRLPEGAVAVSRPTRWGNPFWPGQRVISPGAYGSVASPYHGCRPAGCYGTGPRAYEITRVQDTAEAVTLFASYVRADPSGWPPDDIRYSLGGRDLACWCPPGPCHADVLLELANSSDGKGAAA